LKSVKTVKTRVDGKTSSEYFSLKTYASTMSTQSSVQAHSSQHFEDLQLSSREFYKLLQSMIDEYQYPDVTCTPTTLNESGLFSSRREYLRISRQRHHFYVCASPFGRSFFISWWLKEDANRAANVAERVGWFGRVLSQRLESKTYYELDSELMFTSSINSIIKMAVEKVKADKGFRKDIPINAD